MAANPFEDSILMFSPSTSPSDTTKDSSDKTFIYDVSVELQVEMPFGISHHKNVMETVSAIVATNIFVRIPSWNFLATPILRILDSALSTNDEDWELRENKFVVQMIVHIMGHLTNIIDKPRASSTTFDKFSCNTIIEESKISINYHVRVLFAPGILSAECIYEAHGWTRDHTSQQDDARSLKLQKIISNYQGKLTFDHNAIWRSMFSFKKNFKN